MEKSLDAMAGAADSALRAEKQELRNTEDEASAQQRGRGVVQGSLLRRLDFWECSTHFGTLCAVKKTRLDA